MHMLRKTCLENHYTSVSSILCYLTLEYSWKRCAEFVIQIHGIGKTIKYKIQKFSGIHADHVSFIFVSLFYKSFSVQFETSFDVNARS